MKPQSVALAMVKGQDGRTFITLESARNSPEVMAFVHRFPGYWEWDGYRRVWSASPTVNKKTDGGLASRSKSP